MSLDQIQSLIKSFAEKGKNRSGIVAELVNEGYDPQEIEEAMNGLFSAGKLPPSFWDGYGAAPRSSGKDIRKIILWVVVVVVVIVLSYVGWSWYQGTPRVVADNTYRQLSEARSFEFAIAADPDVHAQGIAVIRSSPALSVQITAPQLPAISVIKKENTNIVFKIEGNTNLTQYAWLSAPPALFFSEAHTIGLTPLANHAGLIRNFSPEKGVIVREVFEKILHGSVAPPRMAAAHAGDRGIALNADGIYKRQLAEAILDSYDSELLDEISTARWDLFVSRSGARMYTLVITNSPEMGRIAGEFDSIRITVQNLNAHSDIPFDAVTTPLENVLVWMREGR